MRNSAGVLIYSRVGDELLVLIVQSRGAKDSEPWSIPKGEFDKGHEDANHAAVREVFEELGLNINAAELVSLGESVYANKRKRVHCFAWEATGALTLKVDEHEISNARFVSIAHARGLLHEAHRAFVDRLLVTLGS